MIPTEWIDYAVSPTYAGEVSPEYDAWRRSEHVHQRFIDRPDREKRYAHVPVRRGITERDMLSENQISKLNKELERRIQISKMVAGHVPDASQLVRTDIPPTILVGGVPVTRKRKVFRGPL